VTHRSFFGFFGFFDDQTRVEKIVLKAEDHDQQDADLYQRAGRNAHQQSIYPKARFETQHIRHGQAHSIEGNDIGDRADVLLARAAQHATGCTLDAINHHKNGQKGNGAGGHGEDAGVSGERCGEVMSEEENRCACVEDVVLEQLITHLSNAN